jgi:phenylpropionate dioxygenase-like ring-hydroxylating dioxygenase large terminal subunit
VDRQQQGAEAWFQRWYPVAYLQDLDPARPTAFTLLEQDLVLWFDRQGGAGAPLPMSARTGWCPSRKGA